MPQRVTMSFEGTEEDFRLLAESLPEELSGAATQIEDNLHNGEDQYCSVNLDENAEGDPR